MTNSVFKTLNAIDFKKHVKSLQGNAYIPWADAWSEVKKVYPSAKFEVKEDEIGNPFTVSPMGIFVKVTVTIENEIQSINYPVLNGANKALKAEAYTYKVKEYINKKPTNKMIDKYVEAATTFDINTAIMRALTKCLALHGAALYIYRDEAMPDVVLVDSSQLQAIQDKCKECGFTISEVAKSWQINTISEFHSATFDSVIEWIDSNKKTCAK